MTVPAVTDDVHVLFAEASALHERATKACAGEASEPDSCAPGDTPSARSGSRGRAKEASSSSTNNSGCSSSNNTSSESNSGGAKAAPAGAPAPEPKQQRRQQLQAAEALYRRVLAVQPRHAHALHQLGVLLSELYGSEKHEEAVRLVRSAVQVAPGSARVRASLGRLYCGAERWAEAVDALERAHEKDPKDAGVLMHLARALRCAGRQQAAAEAYGRVAALQPSHPSAHYRRGAILRSMRRNEEALAAFRQHLALQPDHQAARFWAAAITGDAEGMAAAPPDMVAGLFDHYAERFDDHLVNQLQYRTPEALRDALLEAATGRAAATRGSDAGSGSCSTSGRQGGNGDGSSIGDSSTGSVRQGAQCTAGGGPRPRWRRAVDLGCGTGLMGPLMAPYCTALEGVDLSAGMVEQAGRRGCYGRLAVGELVDFLTAEAAALEARRLGGSVKGGRGEEGAEARVSYDLLVAADVFVYIGDLAPVLRAAASAAAPGALLAFSTEALERAAGGGQAATGREVSGGGSGREGGGRAEGGGEGVQGGQGGGGGPGLKLQLTGRYAHSEAYLREAGAAAGWRLLAARQSVIRQNAGEPIWGHLCVLERGAG